MSLTKNNCVRCDSCGKLSNHKIGEYTKLDKSAGYINAPDWDKDGDKDYCEECQDKAVVVLSCNKAYHNAAQVEFINIEEDFQGRDVLTFLCPVCAEPHRSLILV